MFAYKTAHFVASWYRSLHSDENLNPLKTYKLSTNGQDAVRCFVDGHQRNWDLSLAQIAEALRSSVNRSTSSTPNILMLGREVNQPVDLLFSVTQESEVSPDEHVAELQRAIKLSHETARKPLKSTQGNLNCDYDLKIFTRVYDEGDLVYVLDTATVKSQAIKHGHWWKGPEILVNKFTPYLYRVKLRNAVFTANHDRLKPCRDRKLPRWLEKFGENIREAPPEAEAG